MEQVVIIGTGPAFTQFAGISSTSDQIRHLEEYHFLIIPDYISDPLLNLNCITLNSRYRQLIPSSLVMDKQGLMI
jgi:hypothetical protein